MKYCNLEFEVYKNNIKKNDIAKELGIDVKTLKNKLDGITDFKWKEVCTIKNVFFPDKSITYLFQELDSNDEKRVG